jgi:hypothetical protein
LLDKNRDTCHSHVVVRESLSSESHFASRNSNFSKPQVPGVPHSWNKQLYNSRIGAESRRARCQNTAFRQPSHWLIENVLSYCCSWLCGDDINAHRSIRLGGYFLFVKNFSNRYIRVFYCAKLGTRVIRMSLYASRCQANRISLRGIPISRIRKFQGYRTLGASNFAILGSELKAKELDARTQHSDNHHIG